MSVKRHAVCGRLAEKVRHIYDVKRLFSLPEIQTFLQETTELKRLMQITKETDSFYLSRRGVSKEYDPKGPYDFESWRQYLTESVRENYESLHKDLLYTDEKQRFEDAVAVFKKIDSILKTIGE